MDRIITEAKYCDETGRKLSPAVIRCDCGCKVSLDDSWANDCPKCGTEYNGSGQQLADRSQWGEETGESF